SPSFTATLPTIPFADSVLQRFGACTGLPASRGPPSSLVQLRMAVWTGDARDTRPTAVIRKHPMELPVGFARFGHRPPLSVLLHEIQNLVGEPRVRGVDRINLGHVVVPRQHERANASVWTFARRLLQ